MLFVLWWAAPNSGLSAAEWRRQRLMGRRSRWSEHGILLFNCGCGVFIRADQWLGVWSGEMLPNLAARAAASLVSLFKCLKRIYTYLEVHSHTHSTPLPHHHHRHFLSKLCIKGNFQVSFSFNFEMKVGATKS